MGQGADVNTLRRALLDLHRELLQAQKREVEAQTGRPMSPAQLMQAASDDLSFSWINQIFKPIVALDGARAEGDEQALGEAIAELRGLLADPDESTGFGRRYLQALTDDPVAAELHRGVVAALG